MLEPALLPKKNKLWAELRVLDSDPFWTQPVFAEVRFTRLCITLLIRNYQEKAQFFKFNKMKKHILI
jgi:hypothetical protein